LGIHWKFVGYPDINWGGSLVGSKFEYIRKLVVFMIPLVVVIGGITGE